MAKHKQINIRVSNEEKEKIITESKKYGFTKISGYLRFIAFNTKIIIETKENI